MPKENHYVVTETNARRVCTLAGLQAAEKHRVTLEELKRGLSVSLKEAEADRRSAKFAAKGLLVLKFTKVTCDAFIGLAADLSSLVPGAGKGAKAVKDVYGVTSVVAETGGTMAAGGKPDYADAGTRLAAAGSDFAKSAPAGFVIKNVSIKSELAIAAMNGDKKGVTKSSIDYATELSKFTLDALDKGQASKFVGIAKTTFDYHQALGETFDEALRLQGEAEDRYASQKKQFLDLTRRFQSKIDELEKFIESCEPVEDRVRMGLT